MGNTYGYTPTFEEKKDYSEICEDALKYFIKTLDMKHDRFYHILDHYHIVLYDFLKIIGEDTKMFDINRVMKDKDDAKKCLADYRHPKYDTWWCTEIRKYYLGRDKVVGESQFGTVRCRFNELASIMDFTSPNGVYKIFISKEMKVITKDITGRIIELLTLIVEHYRMEKFKLN